MDELSAQVDESEPSMKEIRTAILDLKNNKAPGIDEVTPEALKYGGEIIVERLHALLRLIWRSEAVPTSWKKAIIIPIFKKGDKTDCKNYRGISLLSILGKVFMKIIHRRVLKRREEAAREEQAGFRPGRSCCDQIFTLRQILEERIRCGKRTIMVFIDFSAAFDSVHRPALWKALEAEGYPPKYIRLLTNTYDGSTSQVRVQGANTKDFSVKTGVRQGCVLSPSLFNIVVDCVMRKVLLGRRGITFGAGFDEHATDLMFADDSAFLTEAEAEAT